MYRLHINRPAYGPCKGRYLPTCQYDLEEVSGPSYSSRKPGKLTIVYPAASLALRCSLNMMALFQNLSPKASIEVGCRLPTQVTCHHLDILLEPVARDAWLSWIDWGREERNRSVGIRQTVLLGPPLLSRELVNPTTDQMIAISTSDQEELGLGGQAAVRDIAPHANEVLTSIYDNFTLGQARVMTGNVGIESWQKVAGRKFIPSTSCTRSFVSVKTSKATRKPSRRFPSSPTWAV